jgi:hypothetical protein
MNNNENITIDNDFDINVEVEMIKQNQVMNPMQDNNV